MSKKQTEHLSEETFWECIDKESVCQLHEHHLQVCDACREQLNELLAMQLELKHLTQLQPPTSFSQTVVSRWKAKEVAFPWFKYLALSCFALTLALSFYLLSQIQVQVSATLVQISAFIIILCIYLLIGLKSVHDPFMLNREEYQQQPGT